MNYFNLKKITYYETFLSGPDEFYMRASFFKPPMFLFHVLRHTAIFFDRCANGVRGIISKLSYHWTCNDNNERIRKV